MSSNSSEPKHTIPMTLQQWIHATGEVPSCSSCVFFEDHKDDLPVCHVEPPRYRAFTSDDKETFRLTLPELICRHFLGLYKLHVATDEELRRYFGEDPDPCF